MVAKLSGREGLEQVMPAVLDSFLTLGTDAQASCQHLKRFHFLPCMMLTSFIWVVGLAV